MYRESNGPKVWRIQKALILNIDCCCASFKGCIVESDSYNAIAWIKENETVVIIM
jgi:hypothetical protein